MAFGDDGGTARERGMDEVDVPHHLAGARWTQKISSGRMVTGRDTDSSGGDALTSLVAGHAQVGAYGTGNDEVFS